MVTIEGYYNFLQFGWTVPLKQTFVPTSVCIFCFAGAVLICISSSFQTWNLLNVNLTSCLPLSRTSKHVHKLNRLVTLAFKLDSSTSSHSSYPNLTFDPCDNDLKQEPELPLCVFHRNTNLSACFTCELQLYFPFCLSELADFLLPAKKKSVYSSEQQETIRAG